MRHARRTGTRERSSGTVGLNWHRLSTQHEIRWPGVSRAAVSDRQRCSESSPSLAFTPRFPAFRGEKLCKKPPLGLPQESVSWICSWCQGYQCPFPLIRAGFGELKPVISSYPGTAWVFRYTYSRGGGGGIRSDSPSSLTNALYERQSFSSMEFIFQSKWNSVKVEKHQKRLQL